MNRFAYLFLILLILLGGCAENEPSTTGNSNPLSTRANGPRPNIVLIMSDDQGYGDLGFHGNPDVHTPVLDSLARMSTRFTNFYVSPVCAPTRSSLLTGRYSLRTGVYDTYNGGAIMSPEEETLAEVLQNAGYTTGIFGKWHLGDNYPFRSQDQGFENSLTHPAGGIGQVGDVHNYFRYDSSYFDPVLLAPGAQYKSEGYCSDVFTDRALEFMTVNKEDPFFMYLAFNAPHTPLQVPQEWYQKYQTLTIDPANYPEGLPFPKMSSRDKEDARKVYAMVENIDFNVGRVLQRLNELEIMDNTMVIFLTDNGPQQLRFTGGLRGSKGTVYEGGIRVPFFLYYPGGLEKNMAINTPAAHIDVLPTLCDLLEIDPPMDLDGKSLLPLMNNESVDWENRPLFFYWRRGFEEPYRRVAVRKGPYKMVADAEYYSDTSGFELFNLEEDPFEQTDIKKTNPEVLADLRSEFDNWYEDIIRSPNLRTVKRIQIGSDFENPVILNRNDAKGPPGIWAQDAIYGYWDINVEKEGLYDITFQFRKNFSAPGEMLVKVGTIQRSMRNDQTDISHIEMKNIQLRRGGFRFESWYWSKGKSHLPFYVKIKKKEDSDA